LFEKIVYLFILFESHCKGVVQNLPVICSNSIRKFRC